MSTGSEVFFFILKQLDAPKLVFLSVFTIIETICINFGKTTIQKWKKDLNDLFAKAHYYVTRLHN